MNQRLPAAGLPFPERVGRYEILLPIASGGMATVYLARAIGARGFEREVALKLMHAHLRESKHFTADLIEEAKLAVRIKHTNVVPTLDAGEDPFGVYLVMDYVEGDALAGLLRTADDRQGAIPNPIGLRILLDALAGLHAAHELHDDAGHPVGLVHRDFSPQNILVGLDGTSRLADFGVAKAATRLGHTQTGLVKGKIGYMAPEQARGRPVDRRCDVWAAGVLAWELLAGRRLYESSDLSTLFDIVGRPPPRLRSVRRDIPAALDEVVAHALSMDLRARCATAAAFAKALVQTGVEIADANDVGAFVRDRAGGKLEQRRARVAEVLALRTRMGELAADAGSTSDTTDPIALPGPEAAMPAVPETIPTHTFSIEAPGVRAASLPEFPLPTDTISVTTPEAAADRSLSSQSRLLRLGAAAAMTFLVGAVLATWIAGRNNVRDDASLVSAAAQTDAASASSASAPTTTEEPSAAPTTSAPEETTPASSTSLPTSESGAAHAPGTAPPRAGKANTKPKPVAKPGAKAPLAPSPYGQSP